MFTLFEGVHSWPRVCPCWSPKVSLTRWKSWKGQPREGDTIPSYSQSVWERTSEQSLQTVQGMALWSVCEIFKNKESVMNTAVSWWIVYLFGFLKNPYRKVIIQVISRSYLQHWTNCCIICAKVSKGFLWIKPGLSCEKSKDILNTFICTACSGVLRSAPECSAAQN